MKDVVITLNSGWIVALAAYLIGVVGWALRVEVRLSMMNAQLGVETKKIEALMQRGENIVQLLQDIKERITKIETRMETRMETGIAIKAAGRDGQ